MPGWYGDAGFNQKQPWKFFLSNIFEIIFGLLMAVGLIGSSIAGFVTVFQVNYDNWDSVKAEFQAAYSSLDYEAQS